MRNTRTLFFVIFTLALGKADAAIDWSDPESAATVRLSRYLQPFTGVRGEDSLVEISTRTLLSGDGTDLEINPEVRSFSGTTTIGFQQLFLRRKVSAVTLSAGMIRENWSVTDGRSSLDIWSRADLRDPLHAERLPYRMLKLTFAPETSGPPLIDVVAAPFHDPSELPIALSRDAASVRSIDQGASRWLTALPTQVGNATTISVPLTYEVSGYETPTVPQYGLRARWIDYGGFDFSLVHGQTISSEPAFDVTARGSVANPGLPIIARISPVFAVVRSYAAGLETTWRDFGLRAEVASLFPSALKDKDSDSRISGDLFPRRKTTVAFGASRESGLRILAFDLVCGGTFFQTFQPEANALVRDPWEKTVALSVDGRTPRGTGVGVKVLRGVDTGGTLVQPSLSKSLENGLALILSADFLEGPQSDFWGQYTDNDRYNFEVRYLF